MLVLEREDRARRARRADLRDDRRVRVNLRRLPPRPDGSRWRSDCPRDAARARPVRPSAGGDWLRELSRHLDGVERCGRVAVRTRLFGAIAADVPGSSTKSMIGHPQGASGAAGVVTAALALRDGFLPPTINLASPDPDCDMDFIPNKGRAAQPIARAVQLPRLRLEEQRDRSGEGIAKGVRRRPHWHSRAGYGETRRSRDAAKAGQRCQSARGASDTSGADGGRVLVASAFRRKLHVARST